MDKDTKLESSKTIEDEKVSAIKIESNVAPITGVTKAKLGVKVLNQYDEDITRLNYSDITVTVGGAANAGILDKEGVLELTLVGTPKEGDDIFLTLVHGKTGVVAQKTVTVSRAAAISKVSFGELYNKDGKTLTQDTNVSKDKFYLPVYFEDQYGNDVTDIKKITGDSANSIAPQTTVTNSNPGVITIEEIKTVKINNKDTKVIEIKKVNLAGASTIIIVANQTGANTSTTVTVGGGVKVASISLGSPEELVTAGKKALFPLTIIDTAGNEIKTIKEYDKLDAKDAISINGPGSGAKAPKVVEVKDKGLFVEINEDEVKKDTAITIVVTSSTGKVATKTVVPKEKAVATVITGVSSKLATSIRPDGNIVINNTDLVVEDQYGQVIKDKTKLADITFTVEAETDKVLKLAADANKKWTLTIHDNFSDTEDTATKLTFKFATGTPAEKDSSAYSKTYSVVADSAFTSYEVEDVKVIYAAKNGDDYKVSAPHNQSIIVKALTDAGEVIELVENTDFTVVDKPDDDEEVKFAKDATEAKVTVTITINKTGEQIEKVLTYSNVKPKVVDFYLVAKAETVAKDAEELDDFVVSDGKVEAKTFHTDDAKIVTVDSYGLKAFVTAVDTLTFVADEPLEVAITGNGTAAAGITTTTVGTDVIAKVKIGGVTKEYKIVVKKA